MQLQIPFHSLSVFVAGFIGFVIRNVVWTRYPKSVSYLKLQVKFPESTLAQSRKDTEPSKSAVFNLLSQDLWSILKRS